MYLFETAAKQTNEKYLGLAMAAPTPSFFLFVFSCCTYGLVQMQQQSLPSDPQTVPQSPNLPSPSLSLAILPTLS